MELYIVEAHYSDYEWHATDLIGVYDSKGQAENVKTEYEQKLDKLEKTKNPIGHESVEDMSESEFKKYQLWQNKRDCKYYFKYVTVSKVKLNKTDKQVHFHT